MTIFDKHFLLTAAILLVAALPVMAAPSTTLAVTSCAIITPPPAAKAAMGTIIIVNNSQDDDTLTAVLSASATIRLHRMTMDGGVMRMRSVTEGLEIKAGETVNLADRDMHLMLSNFKEPLKVGRVLPVVFRFADAGDVQAKCLVTDDDKEDMGEQNEKHRHHHE